MQPRERRMRPLAERPLATLRAAALLSMALAATAAHAQQTAAAGHAAKPPPAPTPRLADGTVDLGGDGIWSQPWITDFGKQLVGGPDAKVPFLPWTKAMYDYNAENKVAYDPEGFCLPPKRIIVIFEGGAHVWREIHMDGRALPKREDINPTYFGYSVGHWEGDTLVVEATGFNEKTWLNFNGTMHTEQLRTIEKFTRPNRDTLHYEATIIDPGAYSEPWTVAWDIPWTAGAELTEYICQENNQFLLKLKDDFGKPFFEDVPVEHLGSKH